MSTQLIVALDVDDANRAKELVDRLCQNVKLFKVGMQLFTIAGPSILEYIDQKGGSVFLDLKFFDIPNTVKSAIRAAKDHGVFSTSLHLLGGLDMLRAATSVKKRPLLWGITLLTSLGDEDLGVLGIKGKVIDRVEDLARLARDERLDGLVCSVREIEMVRKIVGNDLLLITPGIRLDDSCDDQKRHSTPSQAAKKGSDYIVVGRPILESNNPIETVEQILDELNK